MTCCSGSRQAAGPFLECLGVLLRPGGLIVGTGSDPYQTSDRVHLEYHERNRRRDCMAGQNMRRVRYERMVRLARPSRVTERELTRPIGWEISESRPGPGSLYALVLARAGR